MTATKKRASTYSSAPVSQVTRKMGISRQGQLHKYAVIFSLCLSGGCTTSLHGSFIAHSMVDQESFESAQELGNVEGRSCQTRLLYVLAKGNPATTDKAIEDAKNQRSETRFISDISIDDEVKWNFLYSVQCIVVRATAYQ